MVATLSGQQIGTAVGFVAGFFLPGGPQVWATIGGIAGSYISPTVYKAPSIGDAQTQTSQTGMPIPKAFGHPPPFAPTLVDGDKIARKITKTSGGKGAPAETESEGFIATRAFLCCEGEIAAYARITRNGKIIYSTIEGDDLDADSAAAMSQLRLYYGTRDQDPDPSLEALHGVGNTPCYPGRAYFVVVDDDETQTQGAANQYRVEVIAVGTQETTCYGQWIATDGAGNFNTSNGTDWLTNPKFSASATGLFMRALNGRLLLTSDISGLGTSAHYSDDKAASWQETAIPSGGLPNGDYKTAVFDNEFWLLGNTSGNILHGDGAQLDKTTLALPHQGPVSINGALGYQVLGCQVNDGNIPVEVSTDYFATHAWQFIDVADDVTLCVSNGSRILVGGTNSLKVQYTDNGSGWSSAYTLPSIGSALRGGAAEANVWVIIADSGIAVSIDNGASFTAVTLSEEFHPYDVQIGGGLIVAVGEKNNGAGTGRIWTASLSDPYTWTKRDNNFGFDAIKAVAFLGIGAEWKPLPDGGGYYNDAGETFVPCTTRATSTAPQWKDVATEICKRANTRMLSHIDFDNMTDEVPGFLFGNAGLKGSDYLRTLNTFYFVNTPEYDSKIRSIRLGGAISGTLNPDDLLTIEDQDDDLREQPVAGWSRVTLVYPDPANKYIASTQTAPRTSPDVSANSEVKIECPIPFDATRAAQIADILQKIKFCELEGTFKRAFTAEYDKYIPGNAVMWDGRRNLILKKSFDLGMVKFEGRYDRASAYTSVAVGTNAPPPSKQSSNTKGPTLFVGFNSVRLRDSDASPGIYVALRGLFPGWPGCLLQISIDEQASWISAGTYSSQSVIGKLASAVPASGTREPITVILSGNSQVETITDAQVAAGLNRFAMVTDDLAEIGQFKTADENSDGTTDLTDVSAPQLGSVAAAHGSGDAFVKIDTSVFLIPVDMQYSGKTIYFRPVTLGTPAENNEIHAVVFTPQFTGPAVYDAYVDDTGDVYVDDTGATYYTEVT